MAATRTQRKPAPARRRPTNGEPREHRERRTRDRIDRTAKLSEEVFEEVEAGQRAAIQAVKKFVDTVDRTLPPQGEEPSRRQDVIDAAMEMADRLVHTQYEFLRKVVRSAGKSLGTR
jgi:hypothetical protein